jgi:prepilin peptidase CpaA
MTAEVSITLALSYATQATILIAGVIDDLRSRKFHNWLFLACCALALLSVLIVNGWTGLYLSVFGFAAGIAVLLPFVLMGMIGAGDMKLMAAFGIVAGWNTVFSVAVMSLIWGAIFGVVKMAVSGQLKVLLNNMISIVTLNKRERLELHQIPYTIALLMGWLSHLVYQGIL